MTFKVDLSDEIRDKLVRKAEAAGVDVSTYAARVLLADVLRPSLEVALKPVRDVFSKTGMSDTELGDLLEQEKHEARAARRGESFGE